MDSKKIALVSFLIGLIILSVGFIVFFQRAQNHKSELLTDQLATPKVVDDKINNSASAKPQEKVFTEEQIQQKINEMKTQLSNSKNAKKSVYTDEELYFLGNPRQAAIDELKK